MNINYDIKHMENEEKKYFSTRDLYLATTLITLGFYMSGVDYQVEGDKQLPVGYFQFEESEELVETLKKYRQGQLFVEPRQFATNLRSLKAEVNNVYKSPYSHFEKK